MQFRIRSRKLVNSSLQIKLTATFLLVACAASLFQVFLLNRSLLGIARSMDTGGAAVLSQLPSLLLTNVVVTLVILVPLMSVVGIVVTHRIAGPVYRFERHLEAIANGESVGPCVTRKGDELHDLCTKINAAVDYLQTSGATPAPQLADNEGDGEAQRAA